MTGGSGFLGRAVVAELFDEAERRGRALSVRVFDRVDSGAFGVPVEMVVGDVTDPAAVRAACADIDVVVHTASLVDWGTLPEAVLRRVNVDGTRNVVDACLANGVRGLLHTSTMDVVVDGASIVDGDESLPYATRPSDGYARTKIAAERVALGADGAEGAGGAGRALRVAVIRPCGMYGRGDPYHLAAVLGAAKRGALAVRVGDARAVFEHVYVGNAAYLHALAAFALLDADAPCAGEVYFATDHGASNFYDFMAPFVEALGYRMPRRHLPFPVAYGVALVSEAAAAVARPVRPFRPKLTRSAVHALFRDFSVRTDKAARELGYHPRYTPSEAFERSVGFLRDAGYARD